MNQLLLVGVFCCFAVKIATGAEMVEATDTILTPGKVIAYAMQHNISLKSGGLSRKSAELGLVSARNALLPSARTGVTGTTLLSPEQSNTVGASVNADIEIAPSKYAAYTAEKMSVQASEYTLLQLQKDVSFTALTTFVTTAGVYKLIEVEQNNVAYQELKAEEIAVLVEQGVRSRADLLQQKATSAEATVRALQNLQDFRRQQLQLVDYAGLPLTRQYTLDTIGVMKLVALCNNEPVDTLFEGAPEKDAVTAQRYHIKTNESTVKSRKLGYIPSLSLSAGWSVNGSVDGSVSDFAEESEPSLRVGAAISIPIFDKKQRYLQLQSAEVGLSAARIELEKQTRAADKALAEAALDDLLAADRVRTGEFRRAAAEESLRAMEERFGAGASTLSDLKVVQTAFIEAESALMQSRFDRTLSRLRVLYETGRIDHIYDYINNVIGKDGVTP